MFKSNEQIYNFSCEGWVHFTKHLSKEYTRKVKIPIKDIIVCNVLDLYSEMKLEELSRNSFLLMFTFYCSSPIFMH